MGVLFIIVDIEIQDLLCTRLMYGLVKTNHERSPETWGSLPKCLIPVNICLYFYTMT